MTVDGIPSHVARKRSLFSEIREESDLPRITANQPTVWNKNGHSLLVHQQLLINECETLPFVLKHERTFPSKVFCDILIIKRNMHQVRLQ